MALRAGLEWRRHTWDEKGRKGKGMGWNRKKGKGNEGNEKHFHEFYYEVQPN